MPTPRRCCCGGGDFKPQPRAELEGRIEALGDWLVFDRGGKLIGSAVSEDKARDLARAVAKSDQTERIPETRLAMQEATRVGPARRTGDVTEEALRETFGFTGVNFGTWANQAERQAFVNAAYDSFMDLAEILGVPPLALSLNGTLGIAYGAQGGGKASAHFVPGYNEINLTKTKGAGALAHEWGHALDHYFALQAGEEAAKQERPYVTAALDRGGVKLDGLREEVKGAFRAIFKAMRQRDQTPEEFAERRAEVRAKFQRWLEQQSK